MLSEKTILPYVLSRTYLYDGFSFDETIFDRQINGDWRLLRFKKEDKSFFVSLNYIGNFLIIKNVFKMKIVINRSDAIFHPLCYFWRW